MITEAHRAALRRIIAGGEDLDLLPSVYDGRPAVLIGEWDEGVFKPLAVLMSRDLFQRITLPEMAPVDPSGFGEAVGVE